MVIPIPEEVGNQGFNRFNHSELEESGNRKKLQKFSMQADFFAALHVYKAKTKYMGGTHKEYRYAWNLPNLVHKIEQPEFLEIKTKCGFL